MDGVRWAYAASVFAAPLLIKQGGVIINISFHVPDAVNPAYGVAKTATDRLTWEMSAQLKPHNVAVMSLYPGLVRTENVMVNAQYFDMSNSESPQFTGRAIAAVAADSQVMSRTGQNFVVAKLAREYNFDDVDGKRPVPVWE
jgi:dehydrogenase/reductase SDR family member 1